MTRPADCGRHGEGEVGVRGTFLLLALGLKWDDQAQIEWPPGSVRSNRFGGWEMLVEGVRAQ